MKATIGEAIGLNGGSDEIDLLERKMESLNRKILDMVNESLQNGEDVESREEEFKSISEEVEAMKRRIEVIRQSEQDDEKLIEPILRGFKTCIFFGLNLFFKQRRYSFKTKAKII